ncbi:MAG: hypothetical protein V1929_05585 [bacterium]
MSRLEKHAWFNIAVFAAACVLFAIAYPRIGLLPATGCIGLCGLWGLTPRLFYPKGNLYAFLDEREQVIMRRSLQNGHAVFWALYFLSGMLAWTLHRGSDITIPADALIPLVVGSLIVVEVVRSISVLILSKTGLNHAEL